MPDRERKKVIARFTRAVERGQIEIVVRMLDEDASLVEPFRPRPALWIAARHGHEEIARLLLDCGAERGRIGWGGIQVTIPETPIEAAARCGHDPVVELLADGPLDVFEASAAGKIRRVRELLGSDPDAARAATSRDDFVLGPLHFAAFAGREDVVALLLAAGAPPEGPPPRDPRRWMRPLELALGRGHIRIAARLIEAGDIPEDPARVCVCFSLAGIGGRPESVELLLEAGLSLEALRPNGEHCAFVTVRHPQLSALEILLDAGVPIDAQRNGGKTMLHFATGMGLRRFAELLLDRGADPWIRDEKGLTPVDHAARRKNRKMADYLASRGLRPG